MCGRFAAGYETKKVKEALEPKVNIDPIFNFTPNNNVHPSDICPAVGFSDGYAEISLYAWGWRRDWSKRLLINAQSETASRKKTWRNAIQKNRILIPATGWWEWEKAGSKKVPVFHHLDADIIFFGAVSEIDGEGMKRFVILTTGAIPLADQIHPRMPLLIPRENLFDWLDPALSFHELSDRIAGEKTADLFSPVRLSYNQRPANP